MEEKNVKARIRIWVSGRYGRTGDYIVRLTKVERFKNGKINQRATLSHGYVELETITPAYGWGTRSESIVELL